jgi:hypothetical protein
LRYIARDVPLEINAKIEQMRSGVEQCMEDAFFWIAAA